MTDKRYKLLEVRDLPSDPLGSLGKLRTQLVRVYNNTRTGFKTHRMDLLENTLERMLQFIREGRAIDQLQLPSPETATSEKDMTEANDVTPKEEPVTEVETEKEETPKTKISKRRKAKRNKTKETE